MPSPSKADKVTLDRPRYPIGSVDRVLQLLLLFRDRPSIRVADAAAELGVAGSTAHRLLAMLQAHDFIAQDQGTRHYVPGPAIVELGNAVNRQSNITDVARAAAEEVREILRETANLGVLQHTTVVFTAGAECDHALRIVDQTGRGIAAFHSAPGKVLLADLSADRLRALYPTDRLEDSVIGVQMQRSTLEEELAEVRDAGYASNDIPTSRDTFDFLSLAVPIRRGGTVIAALAVAAPASRATSAWRARALIEMPRIAQSLEARIR